MAQQQRVNPVTVAASLKGIDFPCTRDGLVEHARENNGAEARASVGILQQLPERQYHSMAEVEKEVGKIR